MHVRFSVRGYLNKVYILRLTCFVYGFNLRFNVSNWVSAGAGNTFNIIRFVMCAYPALPWDNRYIHFETLNAYHMYAIYRLKFNCVFWINWKFSYRSLKKDQMKDITKKENNTFPVGLVPYIAAILFDCLIKNNNANIITYNFYPAMKHVPYL